jgi:hypothetical protein
VRTQVSLLSAAAVAATVTGSLGTSTANAAVNQLCYGATVTTAFTGTTVVGPYCIPYPGAVDCQPSGTSLGSLFSVRVDACLPAPLNGGISTSGA